MDELAGSPMAKFIRIFVSERHLLLMRVGAWVFMFVATLGLLEIGRAHV